MRYRVKAHSTSVYGAGSISYIDIDATDAAQARATVTRQGFVPLSVSAVRTRFSVLARARFGHSNANQLCQELLALLDAGMGLVEAVEIIESKARDPLVRSVLITVGRQLREGRTFSEALEQAAVDGGAKAFSQLLVASVRTAERTGQLPDALRGYLAYQASVTAVRDKVVAASVYPLLLLAVGGLVIVFLLVYVVPRFSQIYADVGGEHLPLLSRWLMQWGQLMSAHLLLLSACAMAMVATVGYALMHQAVRLWLLQRLCKLPALRDNITTYQLSRFVRTLAMLLKGGVPMVRALDMARDLLWTPNLALGLIAARRAISEGQPISEAFRVNGLATPVGARLLIVGERGGEIGEVMERIAVLYEGEVSRAVAWFSRLFEPLLMVVIGLVIGGVIVLMYMPIFELAGSIQ